MSTDHMSPCEFAEWMQREHGTLVALTKHLKEHIAAMPEANVEKWFGGLRAGFDRLQVHLKRHFEAQESGGYGQAVLDQRPSLAPKIEAAKHEHGELLSIAAGILRDIDVVKPKDRQLIADRVARIQRFMAVAAEHEQRENTLALFASNQDIGTGFG